jgi:hypothetical protein
VLYAAKTAELSQNMSMPKLSNCPAIYPQQAAIIPSTYGIPAGDPWHLLRLRLSSNFKVSSPLKARSFTHIIPTRLIEQQQSNRMMTAQFPLFPGYMFCQFSRSNSKTLPSTPGPPRSFPLELIFPVEQQDSNLMKHELSFSTTPIPS